MPILINQWANVVRWEMRTRLFLRTSEFLWQEGHTAHSTKEEAVKEAKQMNDIYADFSENFMAMPVIKGNKSESERFAGALDTYCIEALMQDGKALQAGTSHYLGQNFAKAFNVKYSNKEGKLDYVWATSWGVSTRLMGALIMTHSDDKGLILPPKIAPIQVVIIPVYKGEVELKNISKVAIKIKKEIELKGFSVKFDNRNNFKPGYKFNEYELKGVPLRIVVGARDLKNNLIELARRDTLTKSTIKIKDVVNIVDKTLLDIQKSLYQKALIFRNNNITEVNSFIEFQNIINEKGGFISAHWDGTRETEEIIKKKTKASIRCIPFNNIKEEGVCVYSGKRSIQRVLFAKAY